MARTKGSKNKPKTTAPANKSKNTSAIDLSAAVEQYDEKIAAAEAAIAELTADLKARKAELKKLTKEKAAAEAAAAARRVEEEKAAILEAIASSGKTAEEIIRLLKE